MQELIDEFSPILLGILGSLCELVRCLSDLQVGLKAEGTDVHADVSYFLLSMGVAKGLADLVMCVVSMIANFMGAGPAGLLQAMQGPFCQGISGFAASSKSVADVAANLQAMNLAKKSSAAATSSSTSFLEPNDAAAGSFLDAAAGPGG